MRSLFEIKKTDAAKNYIFGLANVSKLASGDDLLDLQDDTIAPDDLEEAAYRFVLKFREAGVMHDQDPAYVGKYGDLIESFAITPDKLVALGLAKDAIAPRWWIGFKVAPDVFEKVQSGEFKMFSVQGRATRVPIEGK